MTVSVSVSVTRIRLGAQPLESSLWRVPQAADVACNQTSLNRIVSVAEDCLSPERTYHGCPLMHGLKSGSCRCWQRTDSPPGSNMLRLAYADSGSACKLAGVQIIPLHKLANQILARTFFRSVINLFACPAVGKFSRASSAGGRRGLQSNFAQPDRVGRRGLSEPREDFSRLPTYAFPWIEFVALFLRIAFHHD